MSAPAATAAQLLPTVERALKRARGASRVVLVRADPDAAPPTLRLDEEPAEVRTSSSPLEIRSLVTRHAGADTTLVVLTNCDRRDLGDDLLARVAGREVFPLDRWQSIKELFGVDHISADLSRKRYLADALIEARPVGGYPKGRTRVLDTDQAVAALQREYLGISPDIGNLGGLIHWALSPDAAGRLNRIQPKVQDELRQFLGERFGPGVEALLTIVAQGRSAELIPLAVVGGLVHHRSAGPRETAQVHLQYRLDRVAVSPEAWRALAATADAHLRDATDPTEANGWRTRAEALLTELGAIDLAHLSDELPVGFDQRLAAAGTALDAWDAAPDDPELAARAERAIDIAASHRRANEERIIRLRMAARLIRRSAKALAWGERLSDAAAEYRSEGAWLDWARIVVSRSESEPTLAGVYQRLTDRFDRARSERTECSRAVGATAAAAIPSPLVGVEDALDRVVGPLAADRPLLLVVADGMSWPTWVEISSDLANHGWTPYRNPAGDHSDVAVAALPTITEVSRTSLLCGTLRRGNNESEKRAFAEHPALRHGSVLPEVWHKAQLRAGGLDTVDSQLLDAIADPARRVIAVVINNIDERLKDVAQPPQGWKLPELDPLHWLLDAAKRAGRPVVLTADHGHLLERDGEQITGGTGGGERWRVADREPLDGEIVVHGPRVVTDDHRAVLPWRETSATPAATTATTGGSPPKSCSCRSPFSPPMTQTCPAGSPSPSRRPRGGTTGQRRHSHRWHRCGSRYAPAGPPRTSRPCSTSTTSPPLPAQTPFWLGVASSASRSG